MVERKDWTDTLLESWADLDPEFSVEAYQVTARISRLALHVAQREERVFSGFGLNRGEVGVLSALRIAEPPHRLSPTRLFRGLMLSSAGITNRVDRLEKRGLVRRTRDPNDRRGVLVELTEDGRTVLDQAVRANTRAELDLVSGLDAGERKSLGALLKKMLADLEATGDANT